MSVEKQRPLSFSRTKLIEASRAVVLGRGIEEVEPGRWVLSPASKARAEAMVGYYHSRKELFRRMGAKIVCSGSHGGLALGQDKPPHGKSEAKGIADILIQDEVPGSLITIEDESISTFSNYEQIVRMGVFPPDMPFSTEEPLLVVASLPHGKYRGVPIARAAFGIKQHEHSIGLLPAEKESKITVIREAVGGVATMLAMSEVGVQPYSAAHLEQAGKRFAEFTERPSLLVSAVNGWMWSRLGWTTDTALL